MSQEKNESLESTLDNDPTLKTKAPEGLTGKVTPELPLYKMEMDKPKPNSGQSEEVRLTETITKDNFEDYVAKFTGRYQTENSFQSLVHSYLNLSPLTKLELKIGAKVFKKWHQKKTEGIIRQYASKIIDDGQRSDQIKEDLAEINRLEKELQENASKIKETRSTKFDDEQKYQQSLAAEEQAKLDLEQEFDGKQKELSEKTAATAEEIKARTDAAALVKEKVKEHILKSGIVKVDEMGQISFDEEKIVRVFEDRFLDEVIDGIEKEDGKSGFLTSVKDTYNGVIEYWAPMESYGQLNRVNWQKTVINVRRRGRKLPRYRSDFIVGVPGDGKKLSRGTIDTALSADRSESMAENGRWLAAQKTGLALTALMRRLNPQNQTYLSVFNSQLTEVTTRQLMNEIQPENGTLTNYALDWLIEKLKNSGPSIGYLITDGMPNRLDWAVESAGKFKEHPYIKLRIILVDGDGEAKDNIRRIGRAAGEGTKVIPIQGYQLAGTTIRDLHSSIGEMYDIGSF